MNISLKACVAIAIFCSVFVSQTIVATPIPNYVSTVSEEVVSVAVAAPEPAIVSREVTQTPAQPAVSLTPDPVAVITPAPEQKPAQPVPAVLPAKAAGPYGRLIIPTIALDKPIAPVGLTSAGAMDVLNDPTRVGWYKGGAAPGQIGSAVLDAHVFQAFANLKKLVPGDMIYVAQADGSKLQFKIDAAEVYPYTDTAHLEQIFNRADAAHLNLITCYGSLVSDRTTYTHRLVVYATLIGSV
jgi:LPXTG-site transpeptidase (sortase) family protein